MIEVPHRLAIRVYYEDTDFSGVVYHANYLRFLERGRTEFLRDLGIEQAAMRDRDGQTLAFAVRQLTIDFLKPARMDDLLTVETALRTLGGASLSIGQGIRRGEETLAIASVKVALLSGGRVRRLPGDLIERFGAAIRGAKA